MATYFSFQVSLLREKPLAPHAIPMDLLHSERQFPNYPDDLAFPDLIAFAKLLRAGDTTNQP